MRFGIVISFLMVGAFFFLLLGLPVEGRETHALMSILMMLTLIIALMTEIIIRMKSYRRSKWPHVMGRVTDLEIEPSLLGGNNYRFTYRYTVEDKEFTNNQYDFLFSRAAYGDIWLNRNIKFRESPEEVIGEMVSVYYDQEAPWNSAISRVANRGLASMFYPSSAVTAMSLIYLWILFA